MIWWWLWWWSGEEETEDRASMVAVEVVVSSIPESPLDWDISKEGGPKVGARCGAQMLQLRASRDAEVSPVAVVGLVFSGSRRHLRGELVAANFDAQRRSVQCRFISPVTGHVSWRNLSTHARAQFMLVVVVDFLEDGGLSRCVVFCWWWI